MRDKRRYRHADDGLRETEHCKGNMGGTGSGRYGKRRSDMIPGGHTDTRERSKARTIDPAQRTHSGGLPDDRCGRTATKHDKDRDPEIVERDTKLPATQEYKEARQNVVKLLNTITNLRHRVFIITMAQTANALHSASVAGLSDSMGKQWKKSIMRPHPEYYAILTEIRNLDLLDNDISTSWCRKHLKTLAITAVGEGSRIRATEALLVHLDRHAMFESMQPGERDRIISEITETVGRRTRKVTYIPGKGLDKTKEVNEG